MVRDVDLERAPRLLDGRPGAPGVRVDAGERLPRTRDRLVQRLRDQGIRNEAVLEQIRNVPRHLFVPEALRGMAYSDGPLPIGQDQTISQPYMVALMTEALEKCNVSFCTRKHFGTPLPGETEHYIRLAYSGISVDDIQEGLAALKRYFEEEKR